MLLVDELDVDDEPEADAVEVLVVAPLLLSLVVVLAGERLAPPVEAVVVA